jgi:hypothetical protein
MKHKKRYIVPFLLIFFLAAVRLVLEPVMLKVANEKAETVNPIFAGHIEDLDVAILRGGLRLQEVTGKMKKGNDQFVKVEEVLLDLSWKSLFKGKIKFDLSIDGLRLDVTKKLLAAIEKLPKEEKEKKKLPFELSEITIDNSAVAFPEYPGLNNQKHFIVNNIHGFATGINGDKDAPLGEYQVFAGLSKKDDVKLTGHFDRSTEKTRWDLNAKVQKFDLKAGNKTLMKIVPMNFKKGSLDLYAEAKSEKGEVYGYVKPFLNDVEFIGNRKEFKGPKQFFVELAGAITDFIFQRKKDKEKDVATRVPFIYKDGKFAVEGGEGIGKAIEHGLTESKKVPRGIEDKYRLNTKNPKEVQAQEEKINEEKKAQ